MNRKGIVSEDGAALGLLGTCILDVVLADADAGADVDLGVPGFEEGGSGLALVDEPLALDAFMLELLCVDADADCIFSMLLALVMLRDGVSVGA